MCVTERLTNELLDNGEFKEGVSLTAFDELLRWEKYSYGCSEMVSNLSVTNTSYWSTNTTLIIRSSTLSTNGSIVVPSPACLSALSAPI